MTTRELLLQKSDIREIRPRCDLCSQELTFIEFLLLENRCVFHAGDLGPVTKLSMWKFVKLLIGDLAITRKKVWMKICGLDEHDYAACIGVTKPSLKDIIDEKDMEKLLRAMDKHTGVVA